MEGGKRGKDCSKPVEVRISKDGPFFRASLVGDVESNVQ
jgi:hypothetical protein